MKESLNYSQVNEDDSTLLLVFSGNIDENSNFPEPQTLEVKSLIIDLNKVELINSLGIRAWVRWMKELPSKIITLKNCTPPIVQQMNIVSGFLPSSATIESFYVPFYCDHCDSESAVLMKRNEDFIPKTSEAEAKIKLKSPIPCDNCDAERELDALEDKYFAFLKRGQN